MKKPYPRCTETVDGFYTPHTLGAFGADLGAVACFFEATWEQVSSALSVRAQAWLLSLSAHHLRALGRLPEAAEPMRSGLLLNINEKEWQNAAIQATNLSELEVTLGKLEEAKRSAEQALDFADQIGNLRRRSVVHATMANALLQAGKLEEALTLFGEAERIQSEIGDSPQLYSVRGSQLCELLLAKVERAAALGRIGLRLSAAFEEVEQRARATLAIARRQDWTLDIALDHLTLGRVSLYRALVGRAKFSQAESEIEEAVADLREAGTAHHLPRGLLTRAWLRSAQSDDAGARADLDEAEEIAERGPMPLFLADVNLYRARLFHDREALAECRRLVEKHGYWRRREELEDLEAMEADW